VYELEDVPVEGVLLVVDVDHEGAGVAEVGDEDQR
jgi:hypothetical protein